MDQIQITYTLEHRDVLAWLKYHQKHDPGQRRVKIAAIIMFLAISIFQFRKYFDDLVMFFVLVVSFALFMILIFWLLNIFYRKIGLIKDKSSGALGEHTVTLTDQHLIETTAVNETRTTWNGIHKVVDDTNHIYIYLTASMGRVIPKRAFTNQNATRAFFEMAVQLHSSARAGR